LVNIEINAKKLRSRPPLSILYLTANPDADNSLRVDREVRSVQEAVRRSKLRDRVAIHYSPAADIQSILDGLNEFRPQVVHFSGHGWSGGLLADDPNSSGDKGRQLPFQLLAQAVAATDSPPTVVVLNACESAGARRAFLPPAKAIVVMKNSISDLAATAFATRFYAGVAAGQSLKSAFDQGTVGVSAVSVGETATPLLMCAIGVDAAKTHLT
jgi:hypothetical protein